MIQERRLIAVVIGTRPEAIKMAPVVRALSASEFLRPYVISTGQQRELAQQALAGAGIEPDIDLDLMRPDQSLASLTAKVVELLFDVLSKQKLAACLVHGDTTTALGAALAGFYARIPLGHVEAGLRTYDFERPWPEEMNRRLIDPICEWCFAPTVQSRENLKNERIRTECIHVTGNTVIDALIECRSRLPKAAARFDGVRTILVTGHRRESFGDGFLGICEAIRSLADQRVDVRFVYPVHLNPNVHGPVHRLLGGHPRIVLQEPVPYEQFVMLMNDAFFILTDSGGVQEEAPSLGKPVLVMRDTTERPEGVTAGTCVLVGTNPHRILSECAMLLDDEVEYKRRSSLQNPYGDGLASSRIVRILEESMAKKPPHEL